MLDFPRWKVIWLWFVALACAAAALPSVASVAGIGWPSALPNPKVNLGLDLAGGSHILLEADASQVGRQRLETMEETSARSSARLLRGSRSARFPTVAARCRSSSPIPPRSMPRANRCCR